MKWTFFDEFSFTDTFYMLFYVELDEVPLFFFFLNFIKKWPLHQETTASSRNGHFIKKRPLHQILTLQEADASHR